MAQAKDTKQVRPPAAPWIALPDRGIGYLSVFLNEPLARWPIREVTRPRDNKSDPNIETTTYGLFSTCEPQMRNRIVQDGAATIFFLANRRGRGRLLTGYYHVAWYAEGTRGAKNRDYALAADLVRFVDPVDPKSLGSPIGDVLTSWFRTQKPVDKGLTKELRSILDAQDDRTAAYLAEILRIEQFARARSGFAYPSWGREEGFTWKEADRYLKRPDSLADVPNSSPTGRWRCSDCDHVIENRALLKRCPVCGEMASLRPEL